MCVHQYVCTYIHTDILSLSLSLSFLLSPPPSPSLLLSLSHPLSPSNSFALSRSLAMQSALEEDQEFYGSQMDDIQSAGNMAVDKVNKKLESYDNNIMDAI